MKVLVYMKVLAYAAAALLLLMVAIAVVGFFGGIAGAVVAMFSCNDVSPYIAVALLCWLSFKPLGVMCEGIGKHL